MFGHKEVAALLIDGGAELNAIGNDGETSLDVAETAYVRDTTEVKAAKKETADPLRRHGGKTRAELKAEGKWNTYYSQQS